MELYVPAIDLCGAISQSTYLSYYMYVELFLYIGTMMLYALFCLINTIFMTILVC